jgi:hypothetical protein
MEGGYDEEFFFFCNCLQISEINNTGDIKCWLHKVLLCYIFG